MTTYVLTVIYPDGRRQETILESKGFPEMEVLARLGGWTWTQQVPDFGSFEGHRCSVWADEEGRRNRAEFNGPATKLWQEYLTKKFGARNFSPSLARLFGPVVIIWRESWTSFGLSPRM